MRNLACEACGVEQPMGDMLDVNGRTLCKTCTETFVAERNSSEGVKWHVDPTICGNCGADAGDAPHSELCHVPTCQTCIDFFRNRPFPTWVKAFFAAVIILVAVSLVWNWRFFEGYFEIRAAWGAMKHGQADEAANHMLAAAKDVPEEKDLPVLADYFQGIACLQNDQCQEAQKHLQRCARMPADFGVSQLLQTASASVAFDQKDYPEFLRIAEQIEKQNPNDATAVAQVASAYACIYAARGELRAKNMAEAKLKQAESLRKNGLEGDNYEQRIQYRLQTREIIDSKEFEKRFPNGWKPKAENKT